MHINIPNIINYDGQAYYFGNIFTDEESNNYLAELLNKIEWGNEKVVMFGKEIITKRKVAFYADKGIEYTYTNKTKKGLEWNETLLAIKHTIETYTKVSYNACLLNLYHNGTESMGWHSDDEKEIVPNSSIASVSFGAERKFSFKHKSTRETLSVLLENGSLLEMKGSIQKNWLHAMPKTSRVKTLRINLTFRQMVKIEE